MKNLFFYPEAQNGKRAVIAGVLDGNTLTIAKSVCSNKDKFNKLKGRAIALGRASCPRDVKAKQFVKRGQIVGDNSEILPKKYELNPEVNPIQQFVEIAKSL